MIKEKWYMYRHPVTGEEVKVIVKPGTAKSAQLKKLYLHSQGFKLMSVVKPVEVSKCK
jgi:hypothetical protein